MPKIIINDKEHKPSLIRPPNITRDTLEVGDTIHIILPKNGSLIKWGRYKNNEKCSFKTFFRNY